jgi:hypothetical protein
MAHAFLAKAVYQIPTTRALIDALKARPTLRRLCGWERATDIPSESTFSRAFADFAHGQLPQQLHAALVQTHLGNKLIGHVSRDSTAIEGAEKPPPKAPSAETPAVPKRKPGRPRKGEEPPPPPPKRLELQLNRNWADHLADLPTRCTVGCKRNRQG